MFLPRQSRSGLERSPCNRKVVCSNPSHDRSKFLKTGSGNSTAIRMLGIRCECQESSKMPRVTVFCFFVVYRPTRKCFTHMETSPLPVRGCKFLPMLGSYSFRAVRALQCATPTVTRAYRLYDHLRGPDRGSNPDFRMRLERSTSTPPRRSCHSRCG